jgi:dsDNA-specific endonuclease/ATPase MutS2
MSTHYEERKKIFETMKVLVKPEQEEIYRIIRKSKENYTENSNGIFFDLALISDTTFLQIKEYLNFCLKTRQEMENRFKELEIIRIQNENYTDDEANDEMNKI